MPLKSGEYNDLRHKDAKIMNFEAVYEPAYGLIPPMVRLNSGIQNRLNFFLLAIFYF